MENPPFFLFDGSQLLLKLSKDKNDKLICLCAVAHCDLHDVQHSEYLRTVHSLAKEGLNTTNAAFHILSIPDFQAFIPQHALTLAQDYSFLYMLLPSDESFYLDSCITRLHIERDEIRAKTLLMLLWYSVTNEGDQAIKNIVSTSDASISTKTYAQELLTASDKISQNPSATQSLSSYAELKQERKKTLERISDEALYELDDLTIKIRLAFNKIK
jgi:hypothetical protein